MASSEDGLKARHPVALLGLGLLLSVSIAVRVLAYGLGPGPIGSAAPGAAAPPDASERRTVLNANGDVVLDLHDAAIRLPGCGDAVVVNTVDLSPFGPDPGPAGTPRPGDHVFYYSLGHVVGEAGLAIKLQAIYVLRRTLAALHVGAPGSPGWIGIKMSIPLACDLDPSDVVAALRRPMAP